MAKIFSVGSGGAFKEINPWWVGASSTWKLVLKAWVGVSGSWKQFYGNVPTNMIVLFASDPGAGWAACGYSGTYPMGHDHEGSSQYSDTHSHATTVTGYTGYGTAEQADTAAITQLVMYDAHQHTLDHNHSSSVDHKPLSYEFRGLIPDGADSLPTTARMLFVGSSVPSGWTRSTYTADYFLRLNSSGTGGTLGSATHLHGHGNTGSAAYGVNRQLHLTSYPYHSTSDSHAHQISAAHILSNLPMYVVLDLIQPTSAAYTIPTDVVAFFLGSKVPAGWTRYTAGDGRIPRLNSTGIGGTGGSEYHTHSVSGAGGVYTGTSRNRGANGSSAAYITHSHDGSHSHTDANIPLMPLCRELLMCRKV